MATLTSLSARLRTEIGDLGKSFVWQATATGDTNRYLLPYSPVDAVNMLITVNGVDVSTTVDVEEGTGFMTFDTTPAVGTTIIAAGTYFRYFTVTEIEQFVCDAFEQHTANHADVYGRAVLMDTLPGLEEYPVVVYASALALYTLATDASFDIDITAPDGVMIPRSERYRQLMQMIQVRKEQYKELCSQLGIGLYKIDVFTLRRTSKTTNRYVPVFLPQEVDDRSMPERAQIPMPSYGSAIAPSSVATKDLLAYQGDNFVAILDFPDTFDTTLYTWKSDISHQVGSATKLTSFTIEPVPGANDRIQVSLTSEQTASLPDKAYWDIQGTLIADTTQVKTYMRGGMFTTPQVTQ